MHDGQEDTNTHCGTGRLQLQTLYNRSTYCSTGDALHDITVQDARAQLESAAAPNNIKSKGRDNLMVM